MIQLFQLHEKAFLENEKVAQNKKKASEEYHSYED